MTRHLVLFEIKLRGKFYSGSFFQLQVIRVVASLVAMGQSWLWISSCRTHPSTKNFRMKHGKLFTCLVGMGRLPRRCRTRLLGNMILLMTDFAPDNLSNRPFDNTGYLESKVSHKRYNVRSDMAIPSSYGGESYSSLRRSGASLAGNSYKIVEPPSRAIVRYVL